MKFKIKNGKIIQNKSYLPDQRLTNSELSSDEIKNVNRFYANIIGYTILYKEFGHKKSIKKVFKNYNTIYSSIVWMRRRELISKEVARSLSIYFKALYSSELEQVSFDNILFLLDSCKAFPTSYIFTALSLFKQNCNNNQIIFMIFLWIRENNCCNELQSAIKYLFKGIIDKEKIYISQRDKKVSLKTTGNSLIPNTILNSFYK